MAIFGPIWTQYGLKISKLFSELFRKNFTKFLQFSRVRKARTLPKYFRNSKKVNIRNSRKQKFRKKACNAGPYKITLLMSGGKTLVRFRQHLLNSFFQSVSGKQYLAKYMAAGSKNNL